MNSLQSLTLELEKAEEYLAGFSGGYSGKYLSAEEFHQDFKNELGELKNGNRDSIDVFYMWFSPTREWDDYTNSDDQSMHFGNRIFELIGKIKNPAASKG